MFSRIVWKLNKKAFYVSNEVNSCSLLRKLRCRGWGGENICLCFFSFDLSPFSGLATKERSNAWLTSCMHVSVQFLDKISNPLSFMWEVIPRSNVSIIPPRQLKYLSFSLKSNNLLNSFGNHLLLSSLLLLHSATISSYLGSYCNRLLNRLVPKLDLAARWLQTKRQCELISPTFPIYPSLYSSPL